MEDFKAIRQRAGLSSESGLLAPKISAWDQCWVIPSPE